MRLGDVGQERPAVRVEDGTTYDLRQITDDIDGAFLAGGGIARTRVALDAGRLPELDPAGLRVGAPIARPHKVVCIGLNYRAHAAESKSEIPPTPMLFIKASGTLNDPDAAIVLPSNSKSVDYEAELCVVIGKTARHVSKEDALDYVFGYTCANDVSARDWQRDKALGGGQFARGKSFDGFCPLGPWIETDLDPSNITVRGKHNGKIQQEASTKLLIFSVPFLISYLSKSLTLVPGTVLMTGTPAGCGFAQKPPLWMKPGDVIEIEADGIGTLRNRIV